MYANQAMKQELYDPSMWGRFPAREAESRFVPYLNQFPQAPRVWRQQYADIHSFMVDDILVKVDRMSMANSLEARTPFLDYRLVEFAMRVPSDLNLKGLQTKALLKESLRGKVPDEILFRKKEGFSIPMKNWLRKELKPMLGDVLSADRIKREGYFNSGYIEKLKDEHWRGTANHAHELWSLMMFEIWKEKILAPSPSQAHDRIQLMQA
jgi:asparagine synthase (glutamine-hydrolysing)